MAKNDSVAPQIHEFYSRWFSRFAAIFVAVEVLLVVAAGWLANWLDAMLSPALSFSVTIGILLVAELIFGLIFMKISLDPIDQILRIIARKKGEDFTAPPPIPNEKRFARSGLDVALFALDDTEKSAQNAAPPLDQLTREIVAKLPVGFIVLDAKNTIIAKNKLAPVISDSLNHEYIELDFSGASETIASWLQTSEKQQIFAEKFWPRIQNRLPGEDGRRVFDVLASYSRNDRGGAQTIILTIDRTDDYANDEQSMDFVSMVGHELRGPVTIIRGYLEILGEEMSGTLTEQQQQIFDRLNSSAKTLSAYISNILNANRADRGALKLELEEASVDSLIADVRDDETLSARVSGHEILWKIAPSLPNVVANHSAVSEVMINLIGNAIKYSPSGTRIEVSAEQRNDFVAISVRDHGIGMPDNVMENLFSKFYRSHRSKSAVAGNGLGLYISQIMIEACGGKISVRSTEGEGSTFTFTLPVFATWNEHQTRANDGPAIENHGYIER